MNARLWLNAAKTHFVDPFFEHADRLPFAVAFGNRVILMAQQLPADNLWAFGFPQLILCAMA